MPPNIVEDYEQLRRGALGGAIGYGVTLLMHHGLYAWVQAGHPIAAPGARAPTSSGSRSPGPTDASNRTLVRVLAAIVLSVHEERNDGLPTL